MKVIPEYTVPKQIIETCSDCPFFEEVHGWDGEYRCTRMGESISYSFALENIHEQCPLDEE